MQFRFDPQALFDPGEADDFFASSEGVVFDPRASEFSPANAWWLAELSRLVYRRESEEGHERGADETRRGELLARVGLRERLFFHEVEVCQGAVIEARDETWTALVFRGTNSPQDWLTNTHATLGAWERGGQVHVGFRDALLQQWGRISAAVETVHSPLFVAGHSLGGALATLAASLCRPQGVYTFGSPRVGNTAFGETLAETPVYRLVNNRDAVTEVPLPLPKLGFTHVGQLHYFDHQGQLVPGAKNLSVTLDRFRWETTAERRFVDLPKFLTDHAPCNYTALLARLLGET
jgi:triacylglycerol lipase